MLSAFTNMPFGIRPNISFSDEESQKCPGCGWNMPLWAIRAGNHCLSCGEIDFDLKENSDGS